MSQQLHEKLREWIDLGICSTDIGREFHKRVKQGNVTRDESKDTHLCVYFAIIDSKARRVFIGHHRKSDLWLFNGGHIDQGELPEQALMREIQEELGIVVPDFGTIKPSLLTMTPIDNLPIQKCRMHYDIWYFLPQDIPHFRPDRVKYEKEFYEMKWVAVAEAKKLVTDPATLQALDKMYAGVPSH